MAQDLYMKDKVIFVFLSNEVTDSDYHRRLTHARLRQMRLCNVS